jgi:hypothetical protein
MNALEIAPSFAAAPLPSIFTARPEARTRMRDFFSSHIRNPNTRRAYREAVRQFSGFCAEHEIVSIQWHPVPTRRWSDVESVRISGFQVNESGDLFGMT